MSCDHLKLLKLCTTKKFVGYQWNGLNRFVDTLSRIELFDRFYVFDSEDISSFRYREYSIFGISNFYFDMYLPQRSLYKGKVAYFVGLHFVERVAAINLCAKELLKHNVLLDFNIKFIHKNDRQEHEYLINNINYISKDIDFKENLKHVNEADILVDIVNPVHSGLSFRVFEALYYQKKLITNNAAIKHYDFYHPDNIFIWDGISSSELGKFLNKPFADLKPEIIQKYSFHNWIRNIFDIKPYQFIALPSTNIKNFN